MQRKCRPRKPTESQICPHRACPHPPQLGIEVVDTYSSGLRHPELSADGVHFPGTPQETLHTTHAYILHLHSGALLHCVALHTRRVSPLQARSRGSTRRSFSAPCAIHQRTTSSLKHTGNLRYCSKRARVIARGVSLLFLYFDSVKRYRPGQGDRRHPEFAQYPLCKFASLVTSDFVHPLSS